MKIPTHGDSIEIVDSENGTFLVLIAEEAEALRFARLPVANQVDVHYFSIPENSFLLYV